MTWHGAAFRIAVLLWGESTGNQWIPSQKASNANLIFSLFSGCPDPCSLADYERFVSPMSISSDVEHEHLCAVYSHAALFQGTIYFQDFINSSPSGQNGRHFADDILKCIFGNENHCILIKISLKFVPRGEIGNNPAFV